MFFILTSRLVAGTLMFKDDSKLTDIKIISINKGRIVIEKDKIRKTFPLKKISAYYDTDIKDSSQSTELMGFCDYTVKITSVKIPKRGYDHDKDVTECKVAYQIIRTGNKKTDKIKAPYFYIYVLTSGSDDYGTRKIYRYTYPKEARIRSKHYDQAAIIENLQSFKRPTVHFGRSYRHGKNSLSRGAGIRSFDIPLKSIKNRRILAYHIEAWGNEKQVDEKNWQDFGIKSKRWWERY
jgi:hypothetical protein